MPGKREAAQAGDCLERLRPDHLPDIGIEKSRALATARKQAPPIAIAPPVRSTAASAAARPARTWSRCRSSSGASRSSSAGAIAAIRRASSETGSRAKGSGRRRLAERVLDEARLDVGHAVAEAGVGSRAPIVDLVGVQHDGLAAQAVRSCRRGSRTTARRGASLRWHRCRGDAARIRAPAKNASSRSKPACSGAVRIQSREAAAHDRSRRVGRPRGHRMGHAHAIAEPAAVLRGKERPHARLGELHACWRSR